MNIELWKLVVSIISAGVVLGTVVTGPIIWAIRAEARTIRAEMAGMKTELKGDIANLRTELKGEIAALRSELKGDIAAGRSELKETEYRLNERIDTRLVHH